MIFYTYSQFPISILPEVSKCIVIDEVYLVEVAGAKSMWVCVTLREGELVLSHLVCAVMRMVVCVSTFVGHACKERHEDDEDQWESLTEELHRVVRIVALPSVPSLLLCLLPTSLIVRALLLPLPSLIKHASTKEHPKDFFWVDLLFKLILSKSSSGRRR